MLLTCLVPVSTQDTARFLCGIESSSFGEIDVQGALPLRSFISYSLMILKLNITIDLYTRNHNAHLSFCLIKFILQI